MKEKIVDLALNNASIRDTERALYITLMPLCARKRTRTRA
ncbi:hypothetical protein [Serratia symbiotica]